MMLHSPTWPKERAKTRLPKNKISLAVWTVWRGSWEAYSKFSSLKDQDLCLQLWQCMTDFTKSELCTLGHNSDSKLDVVLEAAKVSMLGKINIIV